MYAQSVSESHCFQSISSLPPIVVGTVAGLCVAGLCVAGLSVVGAAGVVGTVVGVGPVAGADAATAVVVDGAVGGVDGSAIVGNESLDTPHAGSIAHAARTSIPGIRVVALMVASRRLVCLVSSVSSVVVMAVVVIAVVVMAVVVIAAVVMVAVVLAGSTGIVRRAPGCVEAETDEIAAVTYHPAAGSGSRSDLRRSSVGGGALGRIVSRWIQPNSLRSRQPY